MSCGVLPYVRKVTRSIRCKHRPLGHPAKYFDPAAPLRTQPLPLNPAAQHSRGPCLRNPRRYDHSSRMKQRRAQVSPTDSRAPTYFGWNTSALTGGLFRKGIFLTQCGSIPMDSKDIARISELPGRTCAFPLGSGLTFPESRRFRQKCPPAS